MTNFPDILTGFVKDLSDRAYIVGICRATTEIIPESKSWDALEWFDFIEKLG
jgi:hypothetical protein